MMFEGYLPCCLGYFLLLFLFWAFAGYAYRVNERRAADDPKKRSYSPGAMLLVPFWPLLVFGFICLFIIRVLTFGIILVLFTVALVVIRKPFLLIWFHKAATWIGDRLLAANSFLIKLALGDWE